MESLHSMIRGGHFKLCKELARWDKFEGTENGPKAENARGLGTRIMKIWNNLHLEKETPAVFSIGCPLLTWGGVEAEEERGKW